MFELASTQIAYLRELFEGKFSQILGSRIVPGTLPGDRVTRGTLSGDVIMDGTIPASAVAPGSFRGYYEDRMFIKSGHAGGSLELPEVPVPGSRTDVFVNGVLMVPPTHYSISGALVTFTDELSGDDVVVKYCVTGVG